MKNQKSKFAIIFNKRDISESMMLDLYFSMLKPRMIEEKMLILLRQGKISKWFSGIGQEAISVGVTKSLLRDEYVLPMHRNLGVFTSRDIPLHRLFSQLQGKASGFTKGRDRSFHFGTHEFNIIGMISHLGPQFGIADGIALAHILKNQDKVTAVFSGEGGTSEGDFHEALNVSSVWNLPVIFCIENNGYGLSTPTSEQYNCKNIADRGIGYGMESYIIDGNNILEVYHKVYNIANSIRKKPRPILLEFQTFRIRGHEEASGTKYIPQELIKSWKKKDPIENFQNFLLENKLITSIQIKEFKKEITKEINYNLDIAFSEPTIIANSAYELSDVYSNENSFQGFKPGKKKEKIRFVDAISKCLFQSMEKYDDLIIMGQDIAEYGGVFKITEGLFEKFGKNRIRNTPICESSIIEIAYGLSILNIRSIVELQFSDFISTGFNPVVNLLAKSYYRWGHKTPITLRMPCGAGVGAGPYHSQTNEAWFLKTPGLKVVYPAFPFDAKGLLASSIQDENPVLFFEHKALYRSVYQEVPKDYYTINFGEAKKIIQGNKLSVVTYGAGVHWALEIVQEENISVDLIDLRTLVPLDFQCIKESVKKTGKLIILQEDSLFVSIASEISAKISDECFEYLDAPIKRVGSLETPIPFASNLEHNYLAKSRFKTTLIDLLEY